MSRPGERTLTDVQYVAELLRRIATLRDMPHELILDLASCAYLEDLEEGVTREFTDTPGSHSAIV